MRRYLLTGASGMLGGAGQASWYDFARAVFTAAGLDPDRVTPTHSAAFVRTARRPSYSVVGHDAWHAAGIEPMRDWADALGDAAHHETLREK